MMRVCSKTKFKRRGRKDEGQALVLACVGLMFILLMAGLGVDVGYLRYQKLQMQKAADAGAMAGAAAKIYGEQWLNAARYEAAANGFSDGTNGIRVTVNSPPLTGVYASDPSYVEVIVSQPRPTFFMRVSGFNSADVSGRAVASTLGDASGCVYALDPHSANSLLVDGGVSVGTTCGIYVNSDSDIALHKVGGSGTVVASGSGNGIGVVGGYSGTGFIPMPVTSVALQTDPLRELPTPTYSPFPCAMPSGNVYSPGTYCGGIGLSGNGLYIFRPGLYALVGGGLTVTGSPTLQGAGVIFYVTRDGGHPYHGVTLRGSPTAALSAPRTGPWAGILFFQDRSIPVGSDQSIFDGSTRARFDGALYFPTTNIEFKGTPGLATHTVIVGWRVEFKGDSTIKNDVLPGGISPIKTAVLAE